MDSWNDRCEKSIQREKAEIEKKYGIRIGKTEIYCATCGKKWDSTGNNGCSGSVAHGDKLRSINKPLRAVKRATGDLKGIITVSGRRQKPKALLRESFGN